MRVDFCPLILALIISQSFVSFEAKAQNSNLECRFALENKLSYADHNLASDTLLDLASLRIEIDEAYENKNREIAVQLAKEYARKLTGAKLAQLDLEPLPLLIAKLKSEIRLVQDKDLKRQALAIENEWNLSDFKPTELIYEKFLNPSDFTGQRILSGAGAAGIDILDFEHGSIVKRKMVSIKYASSAGLSADQETAFIVQGSPTQAGVWDLKNEALLFSIPYDAKDMISKFSPDGSLLATAGTGGKATVRDSRTGRTNIEFRLTLRDRLKYIKELSTGYGADLIKIETKNLTFSPDNSVLAMQIQNGNVLIWDTKTGALKNVFSAYGYLRLPLLFSADSKHLILASYVDKKSRHNFKISKWAVGSGEVINSFKFFAFTISSLACNSDCSLVAVGQEPIRHHHQASIWEIEREKLAFEKSTVGEITGIDFSADGSQVAISGSGQVVVADTAGGRTIQTLSEESNRSISKVKFSENGRELYVLGFASMSIWRKKPQENSSPE